MNLSACISKPTLMLLSCGLVCLLGHIEQAQAQIFTDAALQGRYAVSLTFGANNGAGLGL